MQPDRKKYPDIPDGAQLSYNAKTQTYQVFREYYHKDESGAKSKKKESIGVISRDGVFSFSKYYTACQEIEALKRQLKKLKSTKRKDAVAISTKEIDCAESDHQVPLSLASLAIITLLCALQAKTDCVSFSEYYNQNFKCLNVWLLESNSQKPNTPEIFRRMLTIIDRRKFESLYCDLVHDLIIRDSAYETNIGVRENSRVCKVRYNIISSDTFTQIYLDRTNTNEKAITMTADPSLLDGFDIKDAIVVADASNTQVCFADCILKAEAQYCLAINKNQATTHGAIRRLFNSVSSDHLYISEFEHEAEYGRIEALSGKFLPEAIKEKWSHLADGSVLKVSLAETVKASVNQSSADFFYISSVPLNQYSFTRLSNVISQHHSIQSNCDCLIDVSFSLDRLYCNNLNYFENQTSLKNLANAIICRYQDYLTQQNQAVSPRQIQSRLMDQKEALKAICVALGIS